jgi:hypothetical protein
VILPRLYKSVPYLLAALPALLPVLMIHRDGVDVPYYDQWDPDIANVILAAGQGKLSPDLFTQHNEHRIFVPKLIDAALDRAAHWNQIADMSASFVVVCCSSLALLWLCRRTLRSGEGGSGADWGPIWLWMLCNLLIFTPAQYENWLWGIGLMNVLPTLWLICAVCIAVSSLNGHAKLAICLLLATAATFSSGNGMMAWLLIGLLLAASAGPIGMRRRAVAGAIWAAGCAINLWLYFRHYQKPAQTLALPPAGAGTIFHYVLVFLGSPLALSTSLDWVTAATILGAIFLIMLAIAAAGLHSRCIGRDADLPGRLLPWLMLAGFAAGSAVMAGIGRGGYGVRQALSPRYSSYAVYLPVSLAALISIRAGSARQWETARKCSVAVFVTVVALLQLLDIGPAFHEAYETRINRLEAKAALLMVNIVPDSDLIPVLLYHTPAVLRQEANQLDEWGWIRPRLVQSDRAVLIEEKLDPAAARPKRGGIDRLDNAANNRLVATGWSIAADQSRPSDAVFLTYEDETHDPKIFWLAAIGGQRDDVVKALGNPDVAQCGWTAVFPANKIPIGTTPLYIRAWALDVRTGTAFELDGNATINRQG